MSIKDKEDNTNKKRVILKEFLTYAIVVLTAIISATLIRSFIIEPFIVPTPSMEPTLKVGDKVLINKIAYKIKPVRKGDIVAFNSPIEEKDLVKRVIALEGEEVTLTSEGEIYVDNVKKVESYLPAGSNISYLNQTIALGENEVFVMGDNRNNSYDSRFFGPIQEESIFGKFMLIYWPPSRW
jgi:signal peptidase I